MIRHILIAAALIVLVLGHAARAGAASPRDAHSTGFRPSAVPLDETAGIPDIATSLRAKPASVIADHADSFLVFNHGFDDLTGACNMRNWTADNLSTKVWAHVDNQFLVNNGFLAMGSKALWFGADMNSDPHEVGHWMFASGYGNNWSQRLTSPSFSRSAHPQAVLRFDAEVNLRRDFTIGGPITGLGLISGATGQEYLGAQALRSDGKWTHLNSRFTTATGPATWDQTPHLFDNQWSSAPGLGNAFSVPLGVAVDDTGNVFVVDSGKNRVHKFDANGRFWSFWGQLGTGGGQFNSPIGVALDAGHNVYVVDWGNNRIQKFSEDGAWQLQWGSTGTGDGQFNGPQYIAVDAGGNVYVTESYRVQKFTSSGDYITQWGSTGSGNGQFQGAEGIAVAPNGDLYVADTNNHRIQEFSPTGAFVNAWGGLGSGNGQFNQPIGVAVDANGFVYVTDRNNNRIEKFTSAGGYLTQWNSVNQTGANLITNPQGIAAFHGTDLYIADTGHNRLQHYIRGGPVAGYGNLKFEVRLGDDENQNLPLADPLQVRIVMQTNNVNSSEDGNLLAGDNGAIVVDNVTLSDGGGNILPAVDFEDGSTGPWTLSARNGTEGVNNLQPSWIRDCPDPGTVVQLQSGFDPNDPSCVWTFTSADGFVHPGLFATLTSPWFAVGQNDFASTIVGYTAKLNGNDQYNLFTIRIRGKNAGDTRPRMNTRMLFLLFGGGNVDDQALELFDDLEPLNNVTFVVPPTGPTTVDSLQVVMEVGDAIERRLGDPATRRSTRLPIIDNAHVFVIGADHDYDGVRDSQDGCPAVSAAGQDADGNGCKDPGYTQRHMESWGLADRPIHYQLSSVGLPGISDGSDLAALRAAFAAWQAVPGANVPLVEDATTTQTNAVSGDGVHLLTFHDDYQFPVNVLAITPTLSFTRRTAFDDRIMLPGQIADADIMFNPAARFRTATQGPASGSFDLQSVATHEIGHFLGLSHSGVLSSTMFPVLQSGTLAATLEDDDRAAIASAYPGPTFATDYGAISGIVTDGKTSAPVPGAFVFAVLLDGGGAPLDTMSSDYTDENGAYVLRRLAPGTYAVRIQPLDGSVPGLLPGAINSQVESTAQTNFQAEWYGGPESNHDDPDVRDPIVVTAGATHGGIDVQTNIDVTPPTVADVAPAAGVTGVLIDAPITVDFSETVDSGTLGSAFRLHKGGSGGNLGGVGQLLSPGISFVFVPSQPLEFATNYQLDITSALTDRAGNPLAATYTSTFRTQDKPPVSISDVEPRQAPVGALITISGEGFDPAAQDKVYFSTMSGTDFVLGTLVQPKSMVVQVPADAASGPLKVVIGSQESNVFGFGLLTSEVVAPAPSGTPVALSFAPSAVAVAPDASTVFAVGGGRFARINLSPSRPLLRVPVETALPGAHGMALVPNGLHAWVTSPDSGIVSEVDTDPNSATYGQAITLVIPGAPDGIAISPSGQRAYVTDQSGGTVYELGVDPNSGGYRQRLRDLAIPNGILSGGIAVDPHGHLLYVGSDQGLLSVDVDTGVVTTLDPTPIGSGIGVTPAGGRLLAAAADVSTGRLAYRDLPSGANSGLVSLGGEPSDIAMSPGGGTAFVANALYAQLQVIDVTQAAPTQVASVGTGLGPAAVAMSASGQLVAVANQAGHSVSLYNNAPAAVSPLRAMPSVAIPGDQVALQVTGTLTAGSALDLDGGGVALAHVTPTAGAFTAPSLPQHDGSLTLTTGGTRSLSVPFRIVDPIPLTTPKPTGFVIDPNDMSCSTGSVDGAMTTLRVSPDGSLLAVSREAPGCVRLDLYRIATSEGTAHLGDRLIDGLSWAPSGTVQDLTFTPDGRRLWAATDAGGLVEINVDPTSPLFRTALPFGSPTGIVRALVADPYGRWMLVGAEPTPGTNELELWSTSRALLQPVPVAGRIHSLAPTPDGRYAVAGGEGLAYVVDLDAVSVVATTPAHSVSPPDAIRSVAVTSDGHKAMGVFPSGRAAVWNTDASQGAIGSELYFGIPAPGADLGNLVAAPNGHDLLAGCPTCNTFAEITPGPTPTVSTTTLAQPVRALARTPDGRQLWVSNWNDGTLLGDLRLFSASTASQIAIVSGASQAVPAGGALPQPIRVQVTDALGEPEEGVVVRFALGAGQGSLDLPGTTQIDKFSDLNGEASVTWTTPATPAALSLSVSALGASGATLAVTASATGSDAATPPTVVEMGPADGASNINFNTSLYVRFSQPMDSTSMEGALSLTQNGSVVARNLSFSEGHRVVLVSPYNPFVYSASAVMQVSAGALAIAGQTLASSAATHFTVEPQPDLKIASVSPPSGPPGVPITLTGEGFDLIPARNTIRIGSVVVPATSVTATTLVTTVPADAVPGSTPITVQVGAATSPAASYQVLSPNPQPLAVSADAATRGGVQAIDITPDGTRAYITIPSSNSVLAYSLRDRTVIKIIPVGLQPQSISILSNGRFAYVANTGSNDVSVIDTDPQSPTYNRTLQTPGHPVKVGSQPTNVASSAFGPQVLVLNSGDGTISVLDAESDNATFDRVLATANAGSGGKQIVITPDGTRAYVANSEGIIMIDLKSKEVTTVASSGSGGKQVVISPDGALLFALTGSGDLLIIDVAPGSVSYNKVVATASTGSGGKQVVISADGTLLYVTLHDQNAVAVFRIVTGSTGGGSGGGVAPGPAASLVPASTIPVGQGPSGMAMSADGSFAVVVNEGSGTISVLGAPALHGSAVTVTPPATCLTPAHACLALPVTIHRDSLASLRAFSVKLQLSSNLALCGTQVDEGNYLSAIGTTVFQVTHTGPGAYTVDATLLGQPCGATATDGTLFTLHLASSAANGTGTVSVSGVTLRDCDNVPITAAAGPDASITIDNTIPDAITALAATPLRTANGNDGTTRVLVSWPAVDAGSDVLVYRAPFGNYPEYDDPPNAGSAPATPAWPPTAPWSAVATVTGGVTSIADEPATRDFWYYTAFVRDACGNVSLVSNLTNGTLDYSLGDVHNGSVNCAGDNRVDVSDVSFLGAHYGATLGTSDPLGCLDVGPTTDQSVEGRPTTDNRLNFEDLIVMAINFGTVSTPQRGSAPAPADSDQVLLEAPAAVHEGDVVQAVVHLRGTGAVQGLSVHLGWSADLLEPLGMTSGGFAETQGGVVMSATPGSVDAALLGHRPTGLTGDGVLATLQFRARATGDPRLVIASVDARGPSNHAVHMGARGGTRILPSRTELAAARPNPFQGTTELHFALARGGPVELVVYAVDGRRVRTLVHETREPGEYQVVWDGTDDVGHVTATGMYYARLSAAGVRMTRSLIRIR